MATYGDNGDRWWVGLNVGSDQSTILGTGSFDSPNGYESLPSGDAADDAKFAAAAAYDATVGTGTPKTISVENVSWYNINGPYSSQASANAAISAIQAAHPAPGEVQQVTAGSQSSAANGGGVDTGSIAAAIGEIGDVVHAVVEPHFWERAAMVLIGGVLLIHGIMKLSGTEDAAMKTISKIPVVPV